MLSSCPCGCGATILTQPGFAVAAQATWDAQADLANAGTLARDDRLGHMAPERHGAYRLAYAAARSAAGKGLGVQDSMRVAEEALRSIVEPASPA